VNDVVEPIVATERSEKELPIAKQSRTEIPPWTLTPPKTDILQPPFRKLRIEIELLQKMRSIILADF
jgi:hypothetical protein